jgi:dienelactone hydrolase
MQFIKAVALGTAAFTVAFSATAQEVAPITESTAGKIEFMSVARDSSTAQSAKRTLKFTDQISGILEFPDKPGKVPAMVVLHGSGGPNYTTATEWAQWLRTLGVATFLVDSFTARSIVNTIGDQSQISFPTSGLDALVALKVISKHPRIDRNRIGVIGFSRGGVATQVSGFEVFRKGVMDDDLKFALHLPFYGSCTRVGKTTGAPIVHFFGSDDDQFNEAGCKRSTEFMRNSGGNIELVIYKGARHGFDSNQVKPYLERTMVTVGKCNQMFDQDNQKYWVEDKPVTAAEYNAYFKSCSSKGMWYQMDSSSKNASRERVKQEVERILKP